jgi:transcriptional regulator with XRE-family HTH domain
MAKGTLNIKTTEMDAEIGGRIRDLRRALGMSQEQVAKNLGITFQQIQKYENGKNRVSASALILICQALGTNPSEMLAGFCGEENVAGVVAKALSDVQDKLSRIRAIAA